jgi:hypothetical protein
MRTLALWVKESSSPFWTLAANVYRKSKKIAVAKVEFETSTRRSKTHLHLHRGRVPKDFEQKVRTNGQNGPRCMTKLEASMTQLVNKAGCFRRSESDEGSHADGEPVSRAGQRSQAELCYQV